MRNANPSIIMGFYCKPKKKKELEEAFKKLNIVNRDIFFKDIEIPIDRKDEVLNFFKHFINPQYLIARCNTFLNSFYGSILIKQIEKNAGYLRIKINKDDWKSDNRHKLLGASAIPLFVQNQLDLCDTEKERQTFKDILTFKSKGYKEKIIGVVKPEDMEMLTDENN